MADQLPPNDPLDNRLRATFAAEHADIERRQIASNAPATPVRSLKWIPFAVAAAVIAIAGFAFIGNRADDQAVELDISDQAPPQPSPVTQDFDEDPADASPNPDNAQPGAASSPQFESGTNLCGDDFDLGTRIVFQVDRGSVPALATPGLSETSVNRMLQDGTVVQLVGGCAIADTSEGLIAWFEIGGDQPGTTEWVQSDYLATTAVEVPTNPAPATNECGREVPDVPHIVWDVGIDDPDGGLIAHTAAGVSEPETRIIRFDQLVIPTGGCAPASNGAAWYELSSPSGEPDWVNAQFLRATQVACLRGEQDGFILRNAQRVHRVDFDDTVSGIAAQYNIEVDELLAANPIIEVVMAVDDLIWIPGVAGEPLPAFGPRDGYAVVDGDGIAFATDTNYRWYAIGDIEVGNGCAVLTGDDRFEVQPCMRVAPPVTSSESDPLDYLSWPGGDASSTADHVHDLRTETNDTCTRIVVTFGDSANEGELDVPSAILPPVIVDQSLDSVRITANGWQLESAFTDPDRIDYPDGTGLLTLAPGFEFAVELLHGEMEPNVRFLNDPARVVVDLYPVDDPILPGPSGNRFVLRRPIQPDRFGPGISVNDNIIVEGFGRPFEAAGLYRIWSVPPNVDADAFLTNPPEPLVEEFFATSSWAEAWGAFSVTLPKLDAGTYIAVFGELPPTDEIGFYGTGQLFRVTDLSANEPGTWPEAVLLPDVQLPPE